MLDDHEQDESAPRNASVDDEAAGVADLHHDHEHDHEHDNEHDHEHDDEHDDHVPDDDEDSAEADAEPQQQQNPDLAWLNDVPQERPPSPSELLRDPAFAQRLLFSFSPAPQNTLPELPARASTDWWSPLLDVPVPTSVQRTTDWWNSLQSGPVPPPPTTIPLFLPSSRSVTPFQPPSRDQTPAWWGPSPMPPMPPPPPPSQPRTLTPLFLPGPSRRILPPPTTPATLQMSRNPTMPCPSSDGPPKKKRRLDPNVAQFLDTYAKEADPESEDDEDEDAADLQNFIADETDDGDRQRPPPVLNPQDRRRAVTQEAEELAHLAAQYQARAQREFEHDDEGLGTRTRCRNAWATKCNQLRQAINYRNGDLLDMSKQEFLGLAPQQRYHFLKFLHFSRRNDQYDTFSLINFEDFKGLNRQQQTEFRAAVGAAEFARWSGVNHEGGTRQEDGLQWVRFKVTKFKGRLALVVPRFDHLLIALTGEEREAKKLPQVYPGLHDYRLTTLQKQFPSKTINELLDTDRVHRTETEMIPFDGHPFSDFTHMHLLDHTLYLREGDRVVITSGAHLGLSGHIAFIHRFHIQNPAGGPRTTMDCAVVHNDYDGVRPVNEEELGPQPFVRYKHLAHHFLTPPRLVEVNDRVRVLGGSIDDPYFDREGRVVEVEACAPNSCPWVRIVGSDGEFRAPLDSLMVYFKVGDFVSIGEGSPSHVAIVMDETTTTRGDDIRLRVPEIDLKGRVGFVVAVHTGGAISIYELPAELERNDPGRPLRSGTDLAKPLRSVIRVRQAIVQQVPDRAYRTEINPREGMFLQKVDPDLRTQPPPPGVIGNKVVIPARPTGGEDPLRPIPGMVQVGKRWEGTEVMIAGKHPRKGLFGRVVGDRDSNEGPMATVKLDMSNEQVDLQIQYLLHANSGLLLQYAHIVPKWAWAGPLIRVPEYAATPQHTVESDDPDWAAGPRSPSPSAGAQPPSPSAGVVSRPQDLDGSWLLHPNLTGKRLDIKVEDVARVAGGIRIRTAQISAEGQPGYVVLQEPLTHDNVGKIPTAIRQGYCVYLPGQCLRPMRRMPDLSSISTSAERVVVIGPQLNGDESKMGRYAQIVPELPEVQQANGILVRFPKRFVNNVREAETARYSLLSLCRSKNEKTTHYNGKVKKNMIIAEPVDFDN